MLLRPAAEPTLAVVIRTAREHIRRIEISEVATFQHSKRLRKVILHKSAVLLFQVPCETYELRKHAVIEPSVARRIVEIVFRIKAYLLLEPIQDERIKERYVPFRHRAGIVMPARSDIRFLVSWRQSELLDVFSDRSQLCISIGIAEGLYQPHDKEVAIVVENMSGGDIGPCIKPTAKHIH